MDQDTSSQQQNSSASDSNLNSNDDTNKAVISSGDKNAKFANGLTYEEIIEKDILELMGFTTLSEEKKQELYKKINEMVENRTASQIYDRLNETDRDEYDKLISSEKNKEAYDFLKARDIDINEILLTETIMLKLELYEDSTVVRKDAKQMIDEETKKKDQNG